MRILVKFATQEYRSEVISPFLSLPECQADENTVIVPGYIKVDTNGGGIDCYCLGIDVAERILSNVCKIQVDAMSNNGAIEFPANLNGALLEAEIDDFDTALELAATGKVEYVNTDKKKLKMVVPLAQWLDADIMVDFPKAIVRLSFHNYEMSVRDNSALQFFTRVKEHPILAANSLGKYLKLQEMRLSPTLEYLTFWKVLKSENGYKRYSQFMNDMQDRLTVTYDQNQKYRCKFEGGHADFQLESIGDKYPKKVIVQIDEFKDIEVLNSLKQALSLKTIELTAKITSLNLSISTLQELGFIKHEDFFLFTKAKDKLQVRYDIGSNTLTAKQDFNIDQSLDPEALSLAAEELRSWLTDVMSHGE